jgi:hypothetical protein
METIVCIKFAVYATLDTPVTRSANRRLQEVRQDFEVKKILEQLNTRTTTQHVKVEEAQDTC